MKMMFRFFAKKLFGVKYERVEKNILIELIVFLGLYFSGMELVIAPFILYLMTGTFTAGVMWQALSSEDNVENMMNLFMFPFEGRKLIASYVSALGAYTIITKTGLLLAVVCAISRWSALEIAGCVLCTINAVVMAACIYSMKKHRGVGWLWAGALIVLIYLGSERAFFIPVLIGNLFIGGVFLGNADAYAFYRKRMVKNQAKKNRHHSVWRYLFRYLMAHTNYLANTAIMWVIAAILPLFFGQIEKMFVLPIGFAILSLNTPICILLSCDPDLERAVRFLPGQKKAFCVPYCLFIFLCNMIADIIFLVAYEVQVGGIMLSIILLAASFAMLSAAGSVLLEWFYPLRGWKIESDLWHHPRKYVVPMMMILLAGVIGIING